MASLTIRGLYKRFGHTDVLKGIDLELTDGEFLVLVGPSGCGKSTLLNIIAGLEMPTEGAVIIGNTDVTATPPRDRDIAMVFQSYALYPTMTVRGNITFGLKVQGVPKAEREAAVARVAEMLQIGPLLDRKPAQLSGGQRQRVAMGRALVRDPKVFLFDEPLSNLDAKLRVDMRHEIKTLHARMNRTIVYVTHDQVEAMTLATRIAVMHKGLIQQFGAPAEIYERPTNLFVAGFMGAQSMNVLPGTLVGSNGTACVRIAEGDGTVDLPLPADKAIPGAEPERPVLLGIRPEAIGHARGDDPAILERTIDMTEPTGADTMLFFSVGGRTTVARLPAREAPESGTRVRLGLDMRSACLFDPQTEERIA